MKDMPEVPHLAVLSVDIDKGMSDLAEGRVKNFDEARIIERGRTLSQTIAEVRRRFADMPTEELESLIQKSVVAARNGDAQGRGNPFKEVVV